MKNDMAYYTHTVPTLFLIKLINKFPLLHSKSHTTPSSAAVDCAPTLHEARKEDCTSVYLPRPGTHCACDVSVLWNKWFGFLFLFTDIELHSGLPTNWLAYIPIHQVCVAVLARELRQSWCSHLMSSTSATDKADSSTTHILMHCPISPHTMHIQACTQVGQNVQYIVHITAIKGSILWLWHVSHHLWIPLKYFQSNVNSKLGNPLSCGRKGTPARSHSLWLDRLTSWLQIHLTAVQSKLPIHHTQLRTCAHKQRT